MNFNPRSREGSDTGGIVTSVLRLISIHAPARGATETLSKAPYISQFQSTLPQGERRSWMHWINGWSPISIHAPARGATVSLVTKDSAHKHFNPRSREGSDHSSRRADRVRYDFNSRSREGSDNRSPAG